EASRAGGVVAERRRERVVHQVRVGAAGRDRDGRVVPAITGSLRGSRSGPHGPAVGGVAHEDVHGTESWRDRVAAVYPGPQEFVGGAGAGGGTVGDGHAGRRGQVVTGP